MQLQQEKVKRKKNMSIHIETVGLDTIQQRPPRLNGKERHCETRASNCSLAEKLYHALFSKSQHESLYHSDTHRKSTDYDGQYSTMVVQKSSFAVVHSNSRFRMNRVLQIRDTLVFG